MKTPVRLALAAALVAAMPALATDSQKSGDTYVYAPTTLGSRTPLAYVAEPNASLATGAPADAGNTNAIVEALNAEASLKGSKITLVPDGDTLLLTGVTVTHDQMQRALEIAKSQAGEGKVANAIKTEELVVDQNLQQVEPLAATPTS